MFNYLNAIAYVFSVDQMHVRLACSMLLVQFLSFMSPKLF